MLQSIHLFSSSREKYINWRSLFNLLLQGTGSTEVISNVDAWFAALIERFNLLQSIAQTDGGRYCQGCLLCHDWEMDRSKAKGKYQCGCDPGSKNKKLSFSHTFIVKFTFIWLLIDCYDDISYVNQYQLSWYRLMPRKQQGWITFQSSEEERQILEQHCQQSQRTKTEVLREMVRGLNSQVSSLSELPIQQREDSDMTEIELFGRKLEAKAMKISARNIFKGTVKQIVTGAVNTEVILEIAPGVEITSIITRASAEQLGLAEGKEAYAVIKSSNVLIAVD